MRSRTYGTYLYLSPSLFLKVTVHDCSISGLDGCTRPYRTHPSRSVVDLRRSTWHTKSPVSFSIHRMGTKIDKGIVFKKGKRGTHQSRQWESISKPSHRGFKITRLKILINPLSFHRRIHIRPYQRNSAPRNPSSLIRYLNRDILFSFNDHHFDRRETVFFVDPETLYDGPQ